MHRTQRTIFTIGCIVAGCGFLGCANVPGMSAAPPKQEPATPPIAPPVVRQAAGNTTDPVAVVTVHFDVLRIELPVDRIQHSLTLWNHIDESKGDPGLTALLARNGFRVGVADQDAWPAMKAILDANGARTSRRQQTATDGLARLISVGEVRDGDTYFIHRSDGGLSGGTFDAGEMLFRIDYATTEADPSRVILRVTPEFRAKRMDTKRVDQGGDIYTIRDFDGITFSELSTTWTLEPNQFIVIGPSRRTDRGYLLGTWWLTSSLNMEHFETVLCITPRVVRVGQS